MKNKEKIFSYILVLITVFILFLSVYLNYKETGQVDTNKLEEAVQIISDEIKVINQSSTEIPELTEADEQTLEVQEVEDEGFELQGDIAYEGDAKHWNISTDTFENIAAEILVEVPCNCCDIFTIKNSSENPVVFNNPSLSIERLA